MASASGFRGWSEDVITFYRGLEADNSRTFWQANKATYDTEVRAPFDALNDLVADEFGELHVFRPNRDVRFSKDKAPYKTRCYGVAEGEGGEALEAQQLDPRVIAWIAPGRGLETVALDRQA